MIRLTALALLSVLALLPGSAAHAGRKDQDEAYAAARQGAILPLGEIINSVRQQVGGSFLGSDFDSGARRYYLKYMREGSVVVVEVDARSGAVLGVTGN